MKEIYELMELFHTLSIGEMKLEYHGMKIFLKKEAEINDSQEQKKTEMVTFSPATENDCEEQEKEGWKQGRNRKIIKEEKSGEIVKAPLTGTFYRSPSPGETPYVSIGQKVKKGDVLAVIEAMKMMNEIVATQEGVVEEILVEDEALVEYDQPLIVIR